MKLKPIDEQVVVVFGASSGIGRAAALAFAEKGARVVASARGRDGLESLVRDITEAGGQAISLVADVASPGEVQAVADLAVEQYGRIDTWVQAASVGLYAGFEDTTPEEFRRVVEVNLLGAAHGAKAALPHLKREGGGALIFVSSPEARFALPYQSAYSASKHGLLGLIETLRLELKHEGVPVSVTNVMPSSTNTPLFDKARTKLGVKPQPVPPFYHPRVAAEAILYAAEHPATEVVAGGAGKLLALGHRMSPWLTETLIELVSFRVQRTDQPKPPSSPDNLFQPVPGHDTVEGTLSGPILPTSLYTWVDTHPVLRKAITVASVGVLAAAGAAIIKGAREKPAKPSLTERAKDLVTRETKREPENQWKGVLREAVDAWREMPWMRRLPLKPSLTAAEVAGRVAGRWLSRR